ncbi:sensor histidine kinase [Maricaulis parjimensis]|uniref:sensor histidine kinase n=1 Tax=Maricaulis parjimensis TaxID=144023 RepID=UPI001EEF5B22|nr:ATP-binding protein [Maricaulis parjimensis]
MTGLLDKWNEEPVWRLAIAACVVMFSAIIMVSWKMGLESMVRVHPSWSPTQFNTALTCFLLGLASLIRPGFRHAAAGLGLCAFIIAVLTGLEHVLGIDLSVDQAFHTHQFVEPGASPGRMSLNSSLVIAALSLTYVSLAAEAPLLRDRLALWSTMVASGFLITFLIGYLLGQVALFNLSAGTGMGVLTLAMTGGICIIKISRTLSFSRRVMASRHATTLIGAGLFLASFSIALLLGISAQHRFNALAGQASELDLLALTLDARFNEQVLALERIADRWQVPGGTPEPAWREDAGNYVSHTALMTSLSLISAQGETVWSVPETGADWAEGSALDGVARAAFDQARMTGEIIITDIFALPGGNAGFLALAPVYTPEGDFDGAMIEVNALDRVDAMLGSLPRRFDIPLHVLAPDEPDPANSIISQLDFGAPRPIRISLTEAEALAHAPPNSGGALFLVFALIASALALQAFHLTLVEQKQKSLLSDINTQLEAANAELDSFAYTASHDLKSPLRGIRQLVDWLGEDLGDAIPDDAKRYMSLLHSRVERLQGLLDALLEYSRVGRKAVSRSHNQLDELTQSALDLLSLPDGHKVEILGGEFDVFTDVNLMQIILMNLISNASKHHDRDMARIQLTLYQTGENWRVEVADDGPGIPEDLHERVFGMFETVKSRDEKEASGMGLAIVAKAVARLDGTITLKSNPGLARGSRFILEFPNG